MARWTLPARRVHYHFLGKGSWDVKNITGAIDVASEARVPLAVLGGRRLNLEPRVPVHLFTLGTLLRHGRGRDEDRPAQPIPRAHLSCPLGGAVRPGDDRKPVYFGCPVFGTPYGSLKEIVGPDVGYLSNSRGDLVEAIKSRAFDARRCHDYVRDTYTSERMTEDYISKYETILNGHKLHGETTLPQGQVQGLTPWVG